MSGLHGKLTGLDEAVGGGGGGANATWQLLWEWDGTTDQFDPADAYNPGGSSASTLSVAADATYPKGALLTYDCDQDSSVFFPEGTQSVRLVTEALPAGAYALEFEIEYTGWTPDANTGTVYGGIAFYAEVDGGGDLYAYTVYCGGAGWGLRIDQGASEYDAGQTSWVNAVSTAQTGIMRFRLIGAKPASSPPLFQFVMGGANSVPSNVIEAYGRQTVWVRGGIPAPPAGWDALDCLRFGLCLAQGSSGIDTSSAFTICGFRVFGLVAP